MCVEIMFPSYRGKPRGMRPQGIKKENEENLLCCHNPDAVPVFGGRIIDEELAPFNINLGQTVIGV